MWLYWATGMAAVQMFFQKSLHGLTSSLLLLPNIDLAWPRLQGVPPCLKSRRDTSKLLRCRRCSEQGAPCPPPYGSSSSSQPAMQSVRGKNISDREKKKIGNGKLVILFDSFNGRTHKHCQRHNGPECWVLPTKVTSLGHITIFYTNLDQTYSESQPSTNFKVSSKYQHFDKT